jgi:hypothetical protein
MDRSITALNKLISGTWWIVLFFSLLIVTFVSASLHATSLKLPVSLGVVTTVIAGLTSIVATLLLTALFALFMKGIGWFFHTRLPYNTYLRIVVVSILIRLLLGLTPVHIGIAWSVITECIFAAYLSIAIWVAVPADRRRPIMLLTGLIPSFLNILFTIRV